MDFLKLQYFTAIAAHRSLTKAAQELYVSQSTLTKFLQKLEVELGGKLFRRNPKSHSYDLTFLGQRYLEYAQRILMMNQDWEKELQDIRASCADELNIAVPTMRSTCVIPQILPEFHALHPGVRVNIYEEGHSIQEFLLTNSKLDFAIFSYWQALPGLCYETLTQEEILLVIPQDHPLAAAGAYREGCRYPWIDLGLFANDPFLLLFPDQNTGRAAQQLFDQYHIQPPVHINSRSSQLCIQLASEGIGVCFAPETYVQQSYNIYPIRAFSVGNPPLVNRLILSYRQNSYLSSYAQDFIAIARRILG